MEINTFRIFKIIVDPCTRHRIGLRDYQAMLIEDGGNEGQQEETQGWVNKGRPYKNLMPEASFHFVYRTQAALRARLKA